MELCTGQHQKELPPSSPSLCPQPAPPSPFPSPSFTLNFENFEGLRCVDTRGWTAELCAQALHPAYSKGRLPLGGGVCVWGGWTRQDGSGEAACTGPAHRLLALSPSPEFRGSGYLESDLEEGWLLVQTPCLVRRGRGGPKWETLELSMGLPSFLCSQLPFIQSGDV